MSRVVTGFDDDLDPLTTTEGEVSTQMRPWLVFSIWFMLCATAVAITWLVTR